MPAVRRSDTPDQTLLPGPTDISFQKCTAVCGNGKIPGQSANASSYAPALNSLTTKMRAAAHVKGMMFGLTTPVLNNNDTDSVVLELNAQARHIMYEFGVPTPDMHAPIVAKCGAVPQDTCFGEKGCWSPHCVGAGYEWLANNTIAPAIRTFLFPK